MTEPQVAQSPPLPPPTPRLTQRVRALVRDVIHAFDPTTVPPRLVRAREVVLFAVHRAREMRLPQVAASLTFTTVLALVPLLAVVLSVFTTFPVFGEFRAALEQNLLRELLPSQHASTVLRYLNDFANKAARLTAFGLGFLVVTAMLMIATVDRTLNELWQVRERRPIAQRVLVYWALLTLGPIVIGASLAASSYLFAASNDVLRQLPRGLRAVLDYAPSVLSALAYAALFVFVPNRKVAWKDAMIGGVSAAVVGEILKESFAAYIRGGVVTNVYGAFSVVPLFLIWVYLSWLVVLLGGAIASTIPMLRASRFADLTRPGNDFITAVTLLRVLYEAQRGKGGGGGDGSRTADELGVLTRTRGDDTERLLRVLSQHDYVRPLGGLFSGRWRLTCDPQRATLRPLYQALAVSPDHSLWRHETLAVRAWLDPLAASDALDRPLAALDARDARSVALKPSAASTS